jgi:hypothetical protein
VLASNVVCRGFIDGVKVSVLASNVVCRGFIDGVKVSVLALNVVDRGFKLRSRQIKDYIIGICCLARSIKEKEQRLVR